MMKNTHHLDRNPRAQFESRPGDILLGRARAIPMPAMFGETPTWSIPGPLAAERTISPQSAWRELYAKHHGYSLNWGDILEEVEGGITLHFVPTGLIGKGARSEILAAVAAKWFED